MNMRSTLSGFNGASDSIDEALAGLGIDLDSTTSDEVAETGTVLYAALTKKYRPLIDALPALSEIAGKELTVLMRTFVRITTQVAGNPEFQKDLAAMQLARAKNRKSAVDAYVKVGFSRKEAMDMLTADIAATRTAIQNASRSASANSSKSSS